MKYTIKGKIPNKINNMTDLRKEDGGQYIEAAIAEGDSPLYIRICSWDETQRHEAIRKLFGKKVKITVEVIK